MHTVCRRVDTSKLLLSPCKEIGGQRYYRHVTYAGVQKLYIQTPTFSCAGPVAGKYKEVQQLPVPLSALGEVVKVDAFVKENTLLPTNAPATWRRTVAENKGVVSSIHKDLAQYDRLYITIEDGAPIFSLENRARLDESLAAGRYRCLI